MNTQKHTFQPLGQSARRSTGIQNGVKCKVNFIVAI